MTDDYERILEEHKQTVKACKDEMRASYEETMRETKRIRRKATILMFLTIPASMLGFVAIAFIKTLIQVCCGNG